MIGIVHEWNGASLKLLFSSLHSLDFYTYLYEMKRCIYCLWIISFLGKSHEKGVNWSQMVAVTIFPKYSVALSVSQWLLSERSLWWKAQPFSREDFPVFPTNLTIFLSIPLFFFRRKEGEVLMLLEFYFGCLKLSNPQRNQSSLYIYIVWGKDDENWTDEH